MFGGTPLFGETLKILASLDCAEYADKYKSKKNRGWIKELKKKAYYLNKTFKTEVAKHPLTPLEIHFCTKHSNDKDTIKTHLKET